MFPEDYAWLQISQVPATHYTQSCFLWNIRRSHYSIAENDVVQREWQGWSQYPWKLIAAIGWCWWSWYGYRLCNLLTKSWHQLVSCFGGKFENEKMNLCDLFPPGEKPNSSRDHAECCQCWFAMLCLLWIYPWVWGKWRESEMWGSEKWSDFCCLVGGMTVWLVWDPGQHGQHGQSDPVSILNLWQERVILWGAIRWTTESA